MVEYADPLPYHFAASYSFLSYQIVFIYNIFHPHIFSGNMISAEVPQKRKKKLYILVMLTAVLDMNLDVPLICAKE